MARCNEDIRSYAKQNSVYLWQIADSLGICNDTFIRKLRHELNDPEKMKVIEIINKLSEKKGD